MTDNIQTIEDVHGSHRKTNGSVWADRRMPYPDHKRRHYTEAEIAYLKRAYKRSTWEDLTGRLVGRTKGAIVSKARELGLWRRRSDRSPKFRFLTVLRDVRESRKIRRRKLAGIMGYDEESIYRWETGATTPSLAMLVDWCESLGMELVICRKEFCKMDDRLIKAVEAATNGVPVRRDTIAGGTKHVVNAGGVGGHWGDAALYKTEQQAIVAYEGTLKAFLAEKKAGSIRFVAGPAIERWHMTRANSAMTHRVTDQRITINSEIELFDI